MAAVRFSKQYVQPNPVEVDYWVDLATNPYGAIIKYYNGDDWEQLNSSGGSASDFDFYTKTQINQMLANKANVGDVDSKVDDSELAEVIKNIQIQEIGNEGIALVLFKYDNTNLAVSLPTATATNPGILSGTDFANFVKQHQLQALYSEMYDLFADIRSKYQLKLKAGKGININRTDNTISVIRDVNVKWEDIPEEDRIELTNNLKAEIATDVDEAIRDVNEALVKTNDATNRANNALESAEQAEEAFTQYSEGLKEYETSINAAFKEFKLDVAEDVSDINDISIISANKADDAITIANAARAAISTLEGLSDVDMSAIIAAEIVTKVEQNALDIQNILSKEVILTVEEFEALSIKDPTVKYYIYEE